MGCSLSDATPHSWGVNADRQYQTKATELKNDRAVYQEFYKYLEVFSYDSFHLRLYHVPHIVFWSYLNKINLLSANQINN